MDRGIYPYSILRLPMRTGGIPMQQELPQGMQTVQIGDGQGFLPHTRQKYPISGLVKQEEQALQTFRDSLFSGMQIKTDSGLQHGKHRQERLATQEVDSPV
jgi:hypothetical protein